MGAAPLRGVEHNQCNISAPVTVSHHPLLTNHRLGEALLRLAAPVDRELAGDFGDFRVFSAYAFWKFSYNLRITVPDK